MYKLWDRDASCIPLHRSYSCVKHDEGFERLFQSFDVDWPWGKLKTRSDALEIEWLLRHSPPPKKGKAGIKVNRVEPSN
jgi:hypothetical protein